MDIIDNIKNRYLSIDCIYRRSFWILFIFGNLLYLFQSTNFLIGHHSYMMKESLVYPLIKLGRFSAHYPAYLTFSEWVPMLFTVLCILFLTLAGILIGRLWEIGHRTFNYVLLGSFLIATPQVFSWIYYTCIGNFMVLFLYALALSFSKKNSKFSFWVAAILICIAFGMYQLSISVPGMIIIGMMLNDCLKSNIKSFLELYKKYISAILAIITGGVLYAIIYLFLKYLGLIEPNYMTDLQNPNSFLYDSFMSFVNSFTNLFKNYDHMQYGYHFVSLTFIILGTIYVIVAAFKYREIARKILIITLLLSLFVMSNIVDFITQVDVSSKSRSLLYSYVFIVLYFMSILISAQAFIIRNISYVVAIGLLYISSINTLLAQREWKFEVEQVKSSILRMIVRMESLPEYRSDKMYSLAIIGVNRSYRAEKFKKEFNMENVMLSPSLKASYLMPFGISYHPPVLPFLDVDGLINIDRYSNNDLTPLMENQKECQHLLGCLEGAKQWPHKNSVFIYRDFLIIILNDEALENLQEELRLRITAEK